MDADLDTLATAVYVKIDDLLAAEPHRAPWRPEVGIAPQITDAELLTLAVMQALLSQPSEARWLRYAHAHLRRLFPYLPLQPGYNKRLRKLAGTMNWLLRQLAADTSLWIDDVWVVDSTPVECARSRAVARGSARASWAAYGYCASHCRYLWGLHLHLIATAHGLPVAFALTGPAADPARPARRRPGPGRRPPGADVDRRQALRRPGLRDQPAAGRAAAASTDPQGRARTRGPAVPQAAAPDHGAFFILVVRG